MRPRCRTAEINFSFMTTIVYDGGLWPKIFFYEMIILNKFLILSKKINFGQRPPSQMIVDKAEINFSHAASRPRKQVAFLDYPTNFNIMHPINLFLFYFRFNKLCRNSVRSSFLALQNQPTFNPRFKSLQYAPKTVYTV